MALHPVGIADTLAIGERKLLDLNGTKVILFHLENGFHAVQANCPHMGVSLKRGKLIDGGVTLQCPFHHAQFDIASGEVRKWAHFPPGIQILNVLRGEKCLKVYPVRVDNGEILVELDD